jgi:hypothetical protein
MLAFSQDVPAYKATVKRSVAFSQKMYAYKATVMRAYLPTFSLFATISQY